jgi:hypothetical protein
MVHAPVASAEESAPKTTVTLRHVQLILSLYAASIVYSFLLLLTEIAWFRNRNAHRVTVSRKYQPFSAMKMQ